MKDDDNRSAFARLINKRALPLFCVLLTIAVWPASAQLSQNSGINSNDTWVVYDTTMNFQGTVTGSTVSVNSTQTYHVESGYDPNGGLVLNLQPTGSTGSDLGISMIRFAGGQVTVFDDAGNPFPVVPPASNVGALTLINLLGINPGCAPICALVVPNLNTYAQQKQAQLQYVNSSPQQYTMSKSISSGPGGTQSWLYTQQGSNWIATSVTSSPTDSSGTQTLTLQFANMSWYDNSANDTSRTNRGYTAQNPPSPTSINTALTQTATSTDSPNCKVSQSFSDGGTGNLVMQHGIFSSGCTWSYLYPILQQDFKLGTVLIPSLTSTNALSQQASSLESIINASGATGFALVGHSQGGLIARSAAQYYQSQLLPGQVAGAATVGAPHQGVPLMLNGQDYVQGKLQSLGDNFLNDLGCQSQFDNPACYLAFAVVNGAVQQGTPALFNFAYSSTAPDLCDMVPNDQCSNFIGNLNSYPENFLQAGILGNANSRWVEFRLIGDFGCGFSIGCQGRLFYTIAQVVYYSAVVGFVISEIFCDFDLANFFASIINNMNKIDKFWNNLVASPGDGIVPSASQQYPTSSAQQFPIPNSDSHPGETHSNRTLTQLETALAQVFKIPTAASCNFSPSAFSFAFSPSATNYSFGVSTQPGCGWHADSQSPWISISAPSGVISGTNNVTFSILANTTTLPRSGTINFGNLSQTLSVTITQNAVCTYTLSPASVFFGSSGGSATISVSTQIGCVWSAVPQVSWITITSGQTGTNSGSFAFSAASNGNATSFIGTILVAGQPVTVYVGSPVGSPGTGWATISGQDLSRTIIYGCPPAEHPCPRQTFYDYGSITLTIGNDPFTVGYQGVSDTPASIASSLANVINAQTQGPVSATVSGSTIYLTAKFDGTITNYPLSVSYTYNTQYFTVPAFTAATSGATLTGGTD